jgi:15-cis-phytoene synthase
MNPADDDLSPPVRLALAYAPQHVRAAFALLLRFDARFARILGNAGEPLIAQMKIAWWRDAIMASVAARPKGEPLLSSLFALDDPALNQAAVRLADAWELLIGEEEWPDATVKSFAEMRGPAIFEGYATLCGQYEFPVGLPRSWAADDLRLRFGSRVEGTVLDSPRLPRTRILRPLTILAMSVRGVSGPRLVWHALTGR